jgi:ankyrin repeat protein
MIDCEEHLSKDEKALFRAIRMNELEVVKSLINSGINLDVQDGYGWTPLMLSVSHFRKEMSKLFIAKTDINTQNSWGYNALMLACMNNQPEIGKLLIDSNTNLDAKDNEGRTALMIASCNNSTEIENYLIEREAK